MSPINQSSSPIKPTTPPAPSSPLFIQLTPTPLIPSAPSNLSPVIAPPQHSSPTPDNSSTISKLPASNLQQLSPNPVQNKPCKFYMQGHCMHGKKGLTVHTPIIPCVSSTLKEVPRVVLKALDVNLCNQSYSAHHLYLESVIVIAVISIMILVLQGLIICMPPVIPPNKMQGSNYHPNPLMQVSVPPPHVPKPVSNTPQTNTVSPPAQTPISDP